MIPQLCRGLVLALMCGTLIQPARAQDKSSQDKKDPQATFEPRSKPGSANQPERLVMELVLTRQAAGPGAIK